MKRWVIDIQKAQKFLNREFSDVSYSIEPNGASSFEVFVNEMIDKDLSLCSEEIIHSLTTTFELGKEYKFYVFSTAEGKELRDQIKSLQLALFFNSYFEEKGV